MFKTILNFVKAPVSTSPIIRSSTSIPIASLSSSFASSSAKVAKPQITFYHNPESTVSTSLLKRLNHYHTKNTRFILDTKILQLPLYHDYEFIHSSCLNMHPNNSLCFESAFPKILQGGSFNSLKVKKESKPKYFINDLDVLSHDDYTTLMKSDQLQLPLVIDYSNHLIATNEEGLDRILANYSTCGMQSSKFHELQHPTNKYGHQVVHPHAAEFADLF